MKKIIIILLSIAILVFILTHHFKNHIQSDLTYSAIISTDGYIIPGEKQDFLVIISKNVDNKLIFANSADEKFYFKLVFMENNNLTKEKILPLSYISPGRYSTSFIFPQNLLETNIKILLYSDKDSVNPLAINNIPVKKEKTIIIETPQEQKYLGEDLVFNIAVLEKKTAKSLFKIPIRVKIITPSGFTSTNRVITTDSNGLASFETNIHQASPEGIYTFVFQSGNFEQSFAYHIKEKTSSEQNLSLTNNNFFITSNKESQLITNLYCEQDNALLSYSCNGSQDRQIEIWQNGKLHYFSNLNQESGTISLVLHKPLLAGCPALFKIWQIKGKIISSHEKIRYIPSHKQNPLDSLLNKYNAEYQNTEKDKLSFALSRKGFIGTSPNFTTQNLTQNLPIKIKDNNLKQLSEIPMNYYEKLLYLNDENQPIQEDKFIVVKDESNLSRSKNSKIILDPLLFFNEYINSIKKQKPNLDNILQEAICRIYRYQYLDLPSQKQEIKNIESLLIPITEIYGYLNKFPNIKKGYYKPILSCVNLIKAIVFIPAEISFDISTNQDNLDNLTLLKIEPENQNVSSIIHSLEKNGKALLKKGNESITIDLNKSEIILSDIEYDKIINLRKEPIIIKL